MYCDLLSNAGSAVRQYIYRRYTAVIGTCLCCQRDCWARTGLLRGLVCCAEQLQQFSWHLAAITSLLTSQSH